MTIGRVLGTGFVVASFGFWVWAFTPWARSENPARLDDRGFVAQAEARCAAAQVEIAQLPTPRQVATPAERADVVALATSSVEALTVDLRIAADALSETSDSDGPSDAALVSDWLQDWDRYIADRRQHVARLRAADESTPDKDFRFLLSDIVPGGVYTERMDGFARLNDMDSCQVPGDL